jgi:rRNA maturation endonuclease Nob1
MNIVVQETIYQIHNVRRRIDIALPNMSMRRISKVSSYNM